MESLNSEKAESNVAHGSKGKIEPQRSEISKKQSSEVGGQSIGDQNHRDQSYRNQKSGPQSHREHRLEVRYRSHGAPEVRITEIRGRRSEISHRIRKGPGLLSMLPSIFPTEEHFSVSL